MNGTKSNGVGPKLGRDRVIHIVGPMDDDMILRILETGVSEAQLLEARQRLERPGEVAAQTQHLPIGVVAEVIEILREAEPEWDEPRDRE